MRALVLRSLTLGIAGCPPLVYAEDAGAIIAALNDPQAECRYLAQKTQEQNDAMMVRELSTTYIKAARAVLKLPKGPKQYEQFKILEAMQQSQDRASDISLNRQAEVVTVEKVIKARRSSLDQ